jgi:hypothetical protein
MLLASASIAAGCLIAGSPAEAKHKPVRHAASPKTNAQAAEIKALRAQLDALTARLDAQEAATAKAQSDTQAVQTEVAAAASQAQAAQAAAAATAQAVPDQVNVALAKAPKPKPNWSDSTVVSGRMYFNASNINQQLTNGTKNAANGTGFNIKRFYLGVDHKFDDVFSGNITTDISNAVGAGSAANFPAAGSTSLIGRGLYVKKAYLQAKLSPAFIIRLGAADMPWIPYDEGIYGYRHIENTLIDRVSFGTSADWGVHVLGDLANGIISYQVSVVDGAGYRNVKVTKSVDVEGRVSAAYKNFFAAVGGYTGKLGNDVQSTPSAPVTVFHTASRFDAMAGYKSQLFTIGGEYFWAKDYNNNGSNYITANVTDKSEGYSAFGSVNFMPKWSAFGRYDWVKPRENGFPTVKDHYFNVGVQYSPAKIVDLALVYKRDKADNGSIATQNGTIGATGLSGTYDEIGLFGQFRF